MANSLGMFGKLSVDTQANPYQQVWRVGMVKLIIMSPNFSQAVVADISHVLTLKEAKLMEEKYQVHDHSCRDYQNLL